MTTPTVHDRIPRNLMRVLIRELKPGEGTWVQRYDLHVCKNGRVLVKTSSYIWPRAYDSWKRNPREDEFFLQRTEGGWSLHVLYRDHITPDSTSISKDDRKDYALVTDILVHPEEDEICSCCQGAGITNLKGIQEFEAYRQVPFKLIDRVYAQLDRLERAGDTQQQSGQTENLEASNEH